MGAVPPVLLLPALLLVSCAAPMKAPEPPPPSPLAAAYGPTVERILAAARTDSRAHERLRHLCDRIGNRLAGSEALDRAIEWAAATMRADGLDEVRTEKVMVPKWVRGECEVRMVAPRAQRLQALAIGNSVGVTSLGTSSGLRSERAEIVADLLAVRDWAGLEALGEKAKGKVVLFHHPMKPYEPGKDPGYGESVDYRVNAASKAAALGAVGVLVCSATARSLGTPHTGMLRYAEGVPQIPAACLSPEDSEMLLRLCESGEAVKVGMALSCGFEPDVPSANVVGEIRGSEKPEEIVLFGGHLDSWDVGQGAHDDGGPCVAVMEAMRILRSLGLKPRRTIRAVLFTNEENGGRGAKQYTLDHASELPNHVAALETDSGAFRPIGFTTPHPNPETEPAERSRLERTAARLREVAALLRAVGADRVQDGSGGADVGHLEPAGVPQIGLSVDEATYFDIHHTSADTFDKVKKEELDLCAGVLAAVVFVLADMPDRLAD